MITPSTQLLSIGRFDVVSYAPNADTISRSTNRDGSGDVVFLTTRTTGRNRERAERKGFIGIANVFEVERLARRELLSSSTSSTASGPLDR